MPLRLDRTAADFDARFTAFLATKREVSEDVDATVRDIIARVRAEGDAALIDYTARFDRLDLSSGAPGIHHRGGDRRGDGSGRCRHAFGSPVRA